MKKWWLFAMFAAPPCGTMAACGARSSLYLESFDDPESEEPEPPDAGEDAPPDVTPAPDCIDQGTTYVYLLSNASGLYRFYPPTSELTLIGTVACPTIATPWSMAVSRDGVAYAVFIDGQLFELSTKTAACAVTTYEPYQLGFAKFGMGYLSQEDGSESLFVSESNLDGPSMGLARLDTETFELDFVGDFFPPIQRAELTSAGDGRLFAYSPNAIASGSHIYEIDSATAKVVADHPLAVGGPEYAYAFALWGGEFYVFTSYESTTTVTKWDPVTETESFHVLIAPRIVGAGVSTCAPQ